MKLTVPQQMVAATRTLQPLVSTLLASAITQGSGEQTVQVGSSALFRASGRVLLSAGSAPEYAQVSAVVDATHITIFPLLGGVRNPNGFANAHSINDFVVPHARLLSLYVERVAGDANTLYVGDGTLNPGANPPTGIIETILGVGSGLPAGSYSEAFVSEREPLENFWVYGSANTVYNVSGESYA